MNIFVLFLVLFSNPDKIPSLDCAADYAAAIQRAFAFYLTDHDRYILESNEAYRVYRACIGDPLGDDPTEGDDSHGPG